MSATKITYNESVIFNISRVGSLRGERSSWACTHSQARGEKHGDYREERRAQCGEGHKKSRAHRGLRVRALIEFQHLGSVFAAVIGWSARRTAIKRTQFRTQTVGNCRIGFGAFRFWGNDRTIELGSYHSFSAGS